MLNSSFKWLRLAPAASPDWLYDAILELLRTQPSSASRPNPWLQKCISKELCSPRLIRYSLIGLLLLLLLLLLFQKPNGSCRPPRPSAPGLGRPQASGSGSSPGPGPSPPQASGPKPQAPDSKPQAPDSHAPGSQVPA